MKVYQVKFQTTSKAFAESIKSIVNEAALEACNFSLPARIVEIDALNGLTDCEPALEEKS